MKFNEAFERLMHGAYIRRKSHPNNVFNYDNNKHCINHNSVETCMFGTKDMMADDWEEVKYVIIQEEYCYLETNSNGIIHIQKIKNDTDVKYEHVWYCAGTDKLYYGKYNSTIEQLIDDNGMTDIIVPYSTFYNCVECYNNQETEKNRYMNYIENALKTK